MWPKRRRRDGDFLEELDSHVALEMKRLVEEDGLSFKDARLQALRSFGNVTAAGERFYESRRLMWVEDLKRDLRHALRSLGKNPGFAAVAVLTLGLGIGATTAIFSVVHGLLLKPLPYQDASRVVRLVMNMPAEESPSKQPLRASIGLTEAEMRAVQQQSKTLSGVGAATTILRAWPGQEEAARLIGSRISASLFDMLAARPAIGRSFESNDELPGAEPVVVLSHAAWQRYLGGDPVAIGRVINMDAVLPPRVQYRYTVVGVMPPDFSYPTPDTQFWIPFQAVNAAGAPQRGNMVGQLRQGVSLDAASAEMNGLLRQMRPKSPGTTYELARERDELTADVRPALLMLTVAVGFVLLIACVNVANLLLARASARQRELAVRTAIGAGRGRLVRQMLTESALLSVLGALTGLALALGGIRLLKTLARSTTRIDIMMGFQFPRLEDVSLDPNVLGFAIAVCAITGLLCGLAPALRHSRVNPMDAFRGAADRGQSAVASVRSFGLNNLLVAGEIGLAMMLLVSSGLLLKSFWTLSNVELGYDPQNVITFQVSLPGHRYSDPQLKDFAEAFTGRLRSIPGVQAAAYANQLPTVNLRNGSGELFRTPDLKRAFTPRSPDVRLISHEYLRVMRIRVVAGRGLDEQDREGRQRVILINQTTAARDFPGENPVGQLVYIGRDLAPWLVAGIVEDVRQFGLDQEPTPQIFADMRQWSTPTVPIFPGGAYYAVRTSGDASAVVANARGIVRQLDAEASLFYIAPMESIVETAVARPRMYAVLVTLFAGVGLVLALLGVYSVMSYSVAQRTREIGIRMSLGAEWTNVVRLVLGQSVVVTAAGIILGCAGAMALSGALEGLLFGLSPLDLATFATAAALFAVTAMLAALVPARRATRIDPLLALRVE